jgi:hypothetical protein
VRFGFLLAITCDAVCAAVFVSATVVVTVDISVSVSVSVTITVEIEMVVAVAVEVPIALSIVRVLIPVPVHVPTNPAALTSASALLVKRTLSPGLMPLAGEISTTFWDYQPNQRAIYVH